MSDANDRQAAAPKRMHKDFFFPTPVYYTDLPGFETLNERLLADIYAWRDQDPGGTFRTNTPQLGGWHSPTDMHARTQFNALTREILEMADGIYRDLGYDPAYEPVCDSMWANINPRHAFNRQHTHPHALWSGVYYVQTPENCGLLSLTDPRPQAQVFTPYFDLQKRAAETWHEVYYQPQPGRLIMFPAWVGHAVQPNLSGESGPKGDRISVSFNLYQRRRGTGPSSPHRNEIVAGDLET
ncbi:MAG: TIGR02466 family protein [Gammaproteobacteria bacterium]|nr:TIGR02466 family protein [Gammaproteobacteria bacterium]